MALRSDTNGIISGIEIDVPSGILTYRLILITHYHGTPLSYDNFMEESLMWMTDHHHC